VRNPPPPKKPQDTPHPHLCVSCTPDVVVHLCGLATATETERVHSKVLNQVNLLAVGKRLMHRVASPMFAYLMHLDDHGLEGEDYITISFDAWKSLFQLLAIDIQDSSILVAELAGPA
jgi:hypothetical protein